MIMEVHVHRTFVWKLITADLFHPWNLKHPLFCNDIISVVLVESPDLHMRNPDDYRATKMAAGIPSQKCNSRELPITDFLVRKCKQITYQWSFSIEEVCLSWLYSNSPFSDPVENGCLFTFLYRRCWDLRIFGITCYSYQFMHSMGIYRVIHE